MSSPLTNRVGTPFQLSGTGGVAKVGNGTLTGIFCSTAASLPTITVYDGATVGATSITVVPEFTPAAGIAYNFDLMFQKGLNIVIGGTVTGVAGYV